jgi:radical SAM superfamily enzyme YgiQ (UPF0313 family)
MAKKKKNILIVQPSFYLHCTGTLIKRATKTCFAPALATSYLASFFPREECDIDVLDESIHPLNFDKKYDLVAISFSTGQAQRAYEIGDTFQARGIAVAMGGYHASACPQEALRHSNAVVVGEFEGVADRFVQDALTRGPAGIYKSDSPFTMESMRFPRYDLVDWKKFSTPLFTKFPLETSRGCPNACDFCCIHVVHGRKPRFRPVEAVLDDVDRIKNDFAGLKPMIFFTDENMVPAYERNFTLLEGLISRKINWSVFLSMESCNHPEYIRLAARAGCTGAVVGFETTDRKNILSVNKVHNKIEDYYRAAELFRKNGIPVYATIMAGFLDDDWQTLDDILAFLKKARIPFTFFYPVFPFPGTKLYERLKAEGALLEETFWLKQHNLYNLLRFRKFTDRAGSFEREFRRMTRRYYNIPAVISRTIAAGGSPRVLAENLGLMILYRRYDSYATI